MKRCIEHHRLRWRDFDLTIIYTPNWHAEPGSPFHHSHLEVMTDAPRVPLPITETGYRSAFLPGGTVEARGGPLPYVSQWLDTAARSRAWKEREMLTRQASLF